METICIVCPTGCRLSVEPGAKGLAVTGNKCPRGEKYGLQEAVDPRRVVTAVIRTPSPDWPCVPVKTTGAIPKKMIDGLLKQLYALTAPLPLNRGAVILKNVYDTGINVCCTRTTPPPERKITK
ncbi:MAG: DUF1667 domain-containing protein [Chitinivibrionales bacterium]|nr:DUF1667 domain-containing protein [Chitinivibrionales bacterium]